MYGHLNSARIRGTPEEHKTEITEFIEYFDREWDFYDGSMELRILNSNEISWDGVFADDGP